MVIRRNTVIAGADVEELSKPTPSVLSDLFGVFGDKSLELTFSPDF